MGGAGNEQAGWRGHLRICAGFLALLLGLILAIPGVPGPGIPLILFGLVALSARFKWAKRILEWGKRKWSHVWLKMARHLPKQRMEDAAP